MTAALLVMDVQAGIVGRVAEPDALRIRQYHHGGHPVDVAGADPEVHRVLTTKVFPRQAKVSTVDEWVAGLKS